MMDIVDLILSLGCLFVAAYTLLKLQRQRLQFEREYADRYPTCYICESNQVNMVLLRCKHARICRACWSKLVKVTGKRTCPDCRTDNNSASSIILPVK